MNDCELLQQLWDAFCGPVFDSEDVTKAKDALRARLAQPEWVRVSDALPDAGPVLAMVQQLHDGKRKAILRACYVKKNTLESNGDGDFGEYDETTDNYYWPEGWYEWNEFEETHWFIDGAVTHWQPLPNHPEWEPDGWQAEKQNKANIAASGEGR